MEKNWRCVRVPYPVRSVGILGRIRSSATHAEQRRQACVVMYNQYQCVAGCIVSLLQGSSAVHFTPTTSVTSQPLVARLCSSRVWAGVDAQAAVSQPAVETLPDRPLSA